MKKILSLVIAILFNASLSSFAQGNLQFNQVKRLKVTATVLYGSTNPIATVTVPANKVWKIESASLSDPSGGLVSNTNSLLIDNQVVCFTTQTSIFFSPQPIWLSSGNYDITVYNGTSVTRTYTAVISAIEYNIVP